ncbi:lipocalin-like domain-containing protein [Chitinophaga niabensis]|uniref:Lipocalin-like n=1 Tax=Chitinophaga niabensis TaxID=536979 RepID=A0A1N6JRL4_9BACT|nr:lipocalin family protein [Chitinophaga niabensis]SIO46962.1 Lipocalin-like [Chitinophaga niabensis]
MNYRTIAFCSLLLMAACQSPTSKTGVKDSVAVPDTITELQVIAKDTPAVAVITDSVHIDSTAIFGKWTQPVQGIDSIFQGFQLKKNGTASSINMETLKYDKWKLLKDTLLLWSHSEGVANRTATIDTLLIKTLNDTVLVAWPITAATGYLETFKRPRKGK